MNRLHWKRYKSFTAFLIVLFIASIAMVGCSSSTTSTTNTSKGNSNDKPAATVKASKFPEKDIEFILPYDTGGYSDWTLKLQPFLKKHMPNNVNVNLRIMVGGGGVTAANYMQKAKPDGYTIAIYGPSGTIATQMVRSVAYDLRKVTWLGRIAVDNGIAAVSSKSPYKSILDFKKGDKPQYIMATKGLSTSTAINGAVTTNKLGIKLKYLNHDGTNEAVLSVVRGDSDITWGSDESLGTFIDSGDLKPILIYNKTRNPRFPDVQIPADIGIADITDAFNVQRLIGAPPGLPEDVRTILETALKEAIADPEFQAVLKKSNSTSSYLDGKESQKLVEDTFTTFEKYKDILIELNK